MFFRSFFFQSMWSFQRMQNVGWLFSLWPVFRRLHKDPAERAQAAQAHAGYFNTHPYTADIILGVVAGMEERRAADGASRHEEILGAKRVMSGPLSALGETIFWAILRPLLLVVAVVAGLFSARRGWWLTPLLYLAVFNVLHVGVKAVGLREGYRRGLDVAAFLVQWPFQVWAARGAWLGLGLCAGVLAALVAGSPAPLVGSLLAAACLFALRKGRSPMVLPLFAAAAGFFWRAIQ
jgi:mannose/fructose/N-acetylgalactosamine-specific phosphotransferase system component IID